MMYSRAITRIASTAKAGIALALVAILAGPDSALATLPSAEPRWPLLLSEADGSAVCSAGVAPAQSLPAADCLATQFPEAPPQGRLVLTVVAQTGPTYDLGKGPDGDRRIVTITGGTFLGTGGLRGVVLPGGADRQRLRADGVRELDAVYELRADDGAILMIHNQVIVDAADATQPSGRYVRSVVRVIAPEGRHAWLNRRVLVGTLTSLRPAHPLVLLRFYELR